MPSPASDAFYAELLIVERFDDVADPSRFVPLPDDWHVAVADVRGSTQHIAAGRYKEVNAIGVSVIIAATNAARSVVVPFVFGGDGATLCVPGSVLADVQAALRATADLARDEYGMELRVGTIPVARVREKGADVLVARHRVSQHYVQAAFAGGGLDLAERLLKSGEGLLGEGPTAGDFSGLECRWRSIPSARGETVSLIVKASSGNPDTAAETYKRVLHHLREVYGEDDRCWPIALPELRLTLGRRALSVETRIRNHGAPIAAWFYALALRVQVLLGMLLFRFGLKVGGVDWGQYKRDVVANSDCRKFDDMLRAVLSGTATQRDAMTDWLEERFRAGKLVYGAHVAGAAMLTCLIENRHGGHFHFVDGADGGYALAAREMKKRLKGESAARTSAEVVSV